MVAAWRQAVEAETAVLEPGGPGARLQTGQPVAVAGLARVAETEELEVDLQCVLVRVEADGVGQGRRQIVDPDTGDSEPGIAEHGSLFQDRGVQADGAPVAPEPDVARPVSVNGQGRGNFGGGQPDLDEDVAEVPTVAEPGALIGPDPEPAHRILVKCPDDGRVERRRESFRIADPALLQQHHSHPIGADQHLAGRGEQNADRVHVIQLFRGDDTGEIVSVVNIDALVGDGPDLSVRAFHELADVGFAKSPFGQACQLVAFYHRSAEHGASPDPAATVFAKGGDRVGRQAVLGVEETVTSHAGAQQAVVVQPKPDRIVRSLKGRADPGIGRNQRQMFRAETYPSLAGDHSARRW